MSEEREGMKIAVQCQILLEAAGLAEKLGKAPIGYRLIDDAGNAQFISVEEYKRLQEEVAAYEQQQSLYYPPLVTGSGVITSTSSEHMQHIREALKLEPAQPAYNPVAAVAALQAMHAFDPGAQQSETQAVPLPEPEPTLRKRRHDAEKVPTHEEFVFCAEQNDCSKCSAAAAQLKRLSIE